MIPSAFVVMEKFPLTPNGKIDRKALPSPEGRSTEIHEGYVAPRDPVEQGLALLWSKVLKVGRVGIHDNFFELGGHSILAVRIVVEIEKLYKKRLPLATLLQAPTVGELAQVLRDENWQPAWSSLVPVRPGGSKPPLFLMHSHGGNVLEYYPLVSHLDADIHPLGNSGTPGQSTRTRRRLARMKRSLASAAAATAFFNATPRLPLASCSAASRPASMTRESSRSSSAVSRGTLPMSFRYRPMESFIVLWSTVRLLFSIPTCVAGDTAEFDGVCGGCRTSRW